MHTLNCTLKLIGVSILRGVTALISRALTAVLLVGLQSSGLPTLAYARQQPAGAIPIAVNSKTKCLRYFGKADGFLLHASTGERLLITASGEVHFGNGKESWETVERRDFVVATAPKTKPDREFAIVRPDKDGQLYVFPKGGDYLLTLGPAAIHNMPSMVIVCHAPLDRSLSDQ